MTTNGHRQWQGAEKADAIVLSHALAATGAKNVLFVTAVAAGEAALAFALVFAMYRSTESVEITDASEMKN